MASSFPSLDLAGSPANPGSSVIHLCMSVKRTVYGSTLGNLSVSAIAIFSVLSQSNDAGIMAPHKTFATESHTEETPRLVAILILMIHFLGVIFIPVRDFDHDVSRAVWHGLAAQARLRRNPRRFVQFIELRIGRFVAGFQTFFHDDVASRACANPAARVIQSGPERFGEIQNAAWQAVVTVGNFLRIDFQCFAAGQKSYFKFPGRRLVFYFFDIRVTAAHESLLLNILRRHVAWDYFKLFL